MKLIKTKEDFVLEAHKNNIPEIVKTVGQAGRHPDWVIIASSEKNHPYLQLSLKNCQAIERGYDLDDLFELYIDSMNNGLYCKSDFIAGAKAILEILGDKKFSEEDMISFGLFCLRNNGHTSSVTDTLFPRFKSLQQTEWDVEIVIELCGDKVYAVPEIIYDEERCLILKRK